MDIDVERQEFQRWLVDHLMPAEFSPRYLFGLDEDGDYKQDFVAHAWEAWLGRASLARVHS
jgi:hypothetical protein